MKRQLLPIFLMLSVIQIAGAAESLQVRVRTPAAEVLLGERAGFTTVGLREGMDDSDAVPGTPALPYKLVHIAIPDGMDVAGVDIAGDERVLAEGVLVHPVQPPHRLSDPQAPAFVGPDAEAYAAAEARPAERVRDRGRHGLRSQDVLAVRVQPLRYRAAARHLLLAEELTVTVRLHREPQAKGPRPAHGRRTPATDALLRGLVANPQDLGATAETFTGVAPSAEQPTAPAKPGDLGFGRSAETVAETAGSLQIAVNRSGGSAGAVGVSYTTANGTATSGSDYTVASGTLTWADGDAASKTITIPIANDTATEGNETFTVTLTNATGGATLLTSSVTVTIADDDTPGTLQWSAASASVAETGGSVTLTVTRSGGSKGAASVNYATANGTAGAGDFTATSGTLTWADGETASKTVTIPILDDTTYEGSIDETFTVVLSGASGATLGTPATATVGITENDSNPNSIRYLIITPEAMRASFQVLADHRASPAGGAYTTAIVSTEYIAANYSGTKPNGGSDLQTQIRNCIKSYINLYDTEYVVLGGSSQAVPDRDCYVTCGSYTQSDMPTDLYYAGCLTGEWDSDRDGVYGEAQQDTDCDLYPDVILGRIVVDTAAQADVYITKLIDYETNLSAYDQTLGRRYLMGGLKLWDSYTGTSIPTDTCNDGHPQFSGRSTAVADDEIWSRRTFRDKLQPYWQTTGIYCLFDSMTSWDGTSGIGSLSASGSNFVTKINELGGVGLIWIDTHGNTGVNAMEGGDIGTGTPGGLTKLTPVYYTGACLSGGFDGTGTSLSEAFIRAPKAAIAYFGCSRYGWGSPGSTYGGDSASYYQQYIKAVYQTGGHTTIGSAFTAHKVAYAPSSTFNGATRWIQFGLNHQGDPAAKLIGIGTVVSIAATDPIGAEPGTDTLSFTISRFPNTAALTVKYAVSGTAAAADYTPSLTGTVNLAAGQSSAVITITPANDSTAEADETLTLTLTADAAYIIDAGQATATATIVDNDGAGLPAIALSTVQGTANEQGPVAGRLRLTRTGSAAAPVTVNYSVGGTAATTDWSETLSGSVTLAAGVTTADLVVTPVDDLLVENDETVVVTVASSAAYTITTGTGTVTIVDNEPVFSVSVIDATGSEPGRSDGGVAFRISRIRSTAQSMTVPLTWSGTATPGSDTPSLPSSVTLAAGVASADVTVTITNDDVAEAPETLICTLVAGTGYGIGTPASATATINDDEAPVVVASVTDSTCTEASSDDGVFTLRRLGDPATALTVNYVLSGTAVNGTDYATLSGTVSIGANSSSATVTVNPTDDSAFEPAETVVLTVDVGTGYTVGSPATASMTLVDNDKPQVSIAATDAEAVEGGNGALYTVSINGAALTDLTVKYAVSGSAIAGLDYATLPGTVLIPTGSSSATIALTATQDALCEAAETATLTISADAANYTIAASPANAATAILLDDSESPWVTIAATDTTGSEPGRTEGTASFTVTRWGSAAAALNVHYVTAGSATAGSDYTALSGNVTIPAGERTAVVTVTVLEDTEAEADETVVLRLKAGSGYAVAHPVEASVTIYDDDVPVVYLDVSDSDLIEATTPTTGKIRFNRRGNKNTPLTIAYTVSGTATAGSDYTALTSPFTLNAGSTSAELTITPINDSTAEGSETVILTLGTGTGYTVGTPAGATLIIRDDETVDVSVSAQDSTAVEGSTDKGAFRITRSASATTALTVSYTLSGTATNGSDYATLSGTATIAANATYVDISVDASGSNDTTKEGEETVVMTLTGGTGQYDITSNGWNHVATVTIRDDDVPTLTVTATDATATEAGLETGTWTITASPAPTATLTVLYTISGGTPGSDYLMPSGTVTIAAGATTATVTLTPLDDAIREGNESVGLTLVADAAYNRNTTGGVNITLVDDDVPTVTVVALDAAAAESPANTGAFAIIQTLTSSASTRVYYTLSGTATPTTDFTGHSTNATPYYDIGSGSLQGSITITPVNDTLAEGPETAILTLAANAAYVIGSPAAATISIADDEQIGVRTVHLTATDAGGTVIPLEINCTCGQLIEIDAANPTAVFNGLNQTLDILFGFSLAGPTAVQ